MIFDLSNPIDLQKYITYTKKLIDKKGFVDVLDKQKRSLNQNSYLHVIISHLAIDKGLDVEYVKLHFYKLEANKDLFPVVKESANFLTGEVIKYYRSSRDLTKEEFTLSIERFRNWSNEVAECYLPSSDEHEFLMYIQKEIALNKAYL